MKKILSLSLLTGGLLVSSVSAFSDINDEYSYKEAVETLQASDIITGYDDGTYKSNNRINRAEFVTLLMRATDKKLSGKNCFPDVKNEWFAPAICTAKDLGYIEGYDDGTYRPGDYINFAEASKIVSNVLDVTTVRSLAREWFEPHVNALEEAKAIPLSIQSADQWLSRGEMAEIVWRVKEDIKNKETQNYNTLTTDLPTFASCSAFEETLKTTRQYPVAMPLMMRSMVDMADDGAVMEAESTAAPTNKVGSGGGNNYSETNIQVKGVDEADQMKTNGKHIFYLRGEELTIVDAYPIESAKVVYTKAFKNMHPQDILLRGNQLIVLGTERQEYPKVLEPYVKEVARMIMPPRIHTQRTKVEVYDITHITHPKLEKDWSFDGGYQTVRRIDGALYLVLNHHFWSYWGGPVPRPLDILPAYRVDGEETKLVGCEDVRYMPGYTPQQWTALVGLDLDDTDKAPSREVIVGGTSSTVYSSKDNFYITTPHVDYNRFTDWNWEVDNSQTLLFKFSLDDGNVDFQKKGRVPGNLLNQFSMDQEGEYIRVATNTRGKVMANHVFVLDKNMKQVGEIRDIAPGEQIYSTRFIGNRLYMVTFKTTDPLFVIDLTSPSKPTILGKLKIPGYSNYLHPYDEDHLIGFGKDATVTKDGKRALYQGMKLALFDVSDVNNPTQKHEIIIGDRGTDSELLHNHKALMWDGQRKLIGFPISVAKVGEKQKENEWEPGAAWGQTEFVGAHVYKVSEENGFELLLQPTHYDADTVLKMGDYWPYDYAKNIQRILYIDDTIYTLSQNLLKAYDILSRKEVKEVSFIKVNKEEQACRDEGGSWQRAGLAGAYRCVKTFSDGGRACAASTQCQGDCIVTDPDGGGICAHNDNPFGCKSVIEDFQETGAILCVD